jgi:hypothetical protein
MQLTIGRGVLATTMARLLAGRASPGHRNVVVTAVMPAVVPTDTAADLFALLWGALSDCLGTAATAIIMRRGRKALLSAWPQIGELSIEREGLEYSYRTPDGWNFRSDESLELLRALTMELGPILLELTGMVMIRRLSKQIEFRENTIAFLRG